MRFIRTVTGDCAPWELGHCQCHEHLFIEKGKSFDINPALWMDDEEASTAEALLYKYAGGGALVDAQPAGAGSMPEALRRVSKRTQVKIIASTGFHKRVFYPENHWLFTLDERALIERFAADVALGIAVDAEGGTRRCGVKAGVVKCALDETGLCGASMRLFRAAAGAAVQTGAPILVHTEDGAHAVELTRFMADLGVPAHRLILCHVERSLWPTEQKLEVARTGAYLECDTIARVHCHSDADGARFLKLLCDEGYEDSILLGLDTTRRRMKSYGAQTGLDYILSDYLPLLRKTGLSDLQIHKFCVENPARALAFSNAD